MKFFEMLMSLFGGKKGGVKDLMKMKDQASDLMKEHGDKLDVITDKIPGTKDDKMVDQARDLLK